MEQQSARDLWEKPATGEIRQRSAILRSAERPRVAAANQSVRPMRLLIVGLNYAPDLIGVPKYTTEFAEWMAERGHTVRVLCGPPYYPAWTVERPHRGWRYAREKRNGVELIRTPLYVPNRPSGAKRLVHLGSFGASVMPVALSSAVRFKPDVVFAVAPALAAAPAALAAASVAGARSWLHVQDFEVDAALELGLLKGKRRAAALRGGERALLKAFDRVSTISGAMREGLLRKGIPAAATYDFRNWTDTDRIRPLPEQSSLRAELGFGDDDVVVLYSGNLAEKQGIDIVVDAAHQLAEDPSIHFVVCGDGPAKQTLRERARGLERMVFLPLQPLERLNDLLNMADIHVLPQKAGVSDLVLPSKLTNMLASGRPVVATAEPTSDLAAEIAGAGIATEPGSASAFAGALLDLARERRRRSDLGREARHLAESRWNREAILSAAEAALVAPDLEPTAASSVAAEVSP